MKKITVEVNGKKIQKEIEDNTILSTFLRDHLNLTGTHVGCDTSQCGACVVHVDGKSLKSCTAFAIDLDGSKITTIEGLGANGHHPVQKAWAEIEVPQCGYCQSGQMMNAAAFLNSNSAPSEKEIIDAQQGNICRCITYNRIKTAIKRASEIMQGA